MRTIALVDDDRNILTSVSIERISQAGNVVGNALVPEKKIGPHVMEKSRQPSGKSAPR